MKSTASLTKLLFLSGLTAIGIGGATLFFPAEFSASADIDLGGNASLLSETRSSGGFLLVCGLLILTGAFVQMLTYSAITLSTLLYLSYGIARVLSIWLDGSPTETFIQAAILEWTFGLVSLFFLLSRRSSAIIVALN